MAFRASIAAFVAFAVAGAAYGIGAVSGGEVWFEAARVGWFALTAITLAATLLRVARDLRRRNFGVDWVALLALAGALAFGELLAGALIAVMLLGGSALEQYAAGRARRQLEALLAEAPTQGHLEVDGRLQDVPIADVRMGDILLVRVGEVVPADGYLLSERAVVDLSALTGESRPVTIEQGEILQSGTANTGSAVRLEVAREASKSAYAGVIRLVEQAAASKGNLVRVADRYALVFVGATLLMASAAWLLSGDAVRALAVLVVATPCPLILGAPTAIVSGVSRAAKSGVLVKGGAALESLAGVRRIIFDKTGTVTRGRPSVVAIEALAGTEPNELLQLCASVEQASMHPFADVLIKAARDRGLVLAVPEQTHERLGEGVEGRVGGATVRVGQVAYVAQDQQESPFVRRIRSRTLLEGSSSVFVSRDGKLLGAILLQDTPRPEVPRVLEMLRRSGVRSVEMVTGDQRDVALIVGEALGFDRISAERSPEQKLQAVRESRALGVTAMLGDGINDAPALAAADIGIAMGVRGATAASEAADIVLTRDSLLGLLTGIRIAKRTKRIALQSVFVGMGASLIAMVFAAIGWIAPAAGALLQELIDLAVIANALRALRGGEAKRPVQSARLAMHQNLSRQHAELQPRVALIARLANEIEDLSAVEALRRLQALVSILEDELLPHEAKEQEEAYTMLAQMLRDEDPTGPLIRTHQEIRRLVATLRRLIGDIGTAGPDPEQLREARKQLYGLHAIVSLHFAQEDELYALLSE